MRSCGEAPGTARGPGLRLPRLAIRVEVAKANLPAPAVEMGIALVHPDARASRFPLADADELGSNGGLTDEPGCEVGGRAWR